MSQTLLAVTDWLCNVHWPDEMIGNLLEALLPMKSRRWVLCFGVCGVRFVCVYVLLQSRCSSICTLSVQLICLSLWNSISDETFLDNGFLEATHILRPLFAGWQTGTLVVSNCTALCLQSWPKFGASCLKFCARVRIKLLANLNSLPNMATGMCFCKQTFRWTQVDGISMCKCMCACLRMYMSMCIFSISCIQYDVVFWDVNYTKSELAIGVSAYRHRSEMLTLSGRLHWRCIAEIFDHSWSRETDSQRCVFVWSGGESQKSWEIRSKRRYRSIYSSLTLGSPDIWHCRDVWKHFYCECTEQKPSSFSIFMS